MVRGAAALAAAGVLAKVLSATYRVLVARWLGAEAVGLYELAAPVLGAALSLCSIGLPVAVSALVAGALGRRDVEAAHRLRAAARRLLFLSGLAGSLAVEVAAPSLARLLGNAQVVGPLRALAPAILLAVYLAGEKAWLQGSGRVAASAVVVVAEQLGRVAAALFAAGRYVGLSGDAGPLAPAAATAVAWSPALGSLTGAAVSVVADTLVPGPAGGAGSRPTPAPEGGAGAGPSVQRAAGRSPEAILVAGGLPNWLSGVVTSLATAVDAALVAWRLRVAAGYSAYAATAALGELNGMALPLATGPTVLFGALATAFIPSASADWARGDRAGVRRQGEAAYFWVLAAALPLALGLWQLAQPISLLLYRNPQAAAPLAALAPVGAALGLSYVAGAMANAVGEPVVLVPGVVAGAVAKTILVLLLTGRGGLGVRGAALGGLAGALVSAALNLHAVQRRTGCRPPWARAAFACVPALLAQGAAAQAAWRAWPAGGVAMRLGLALGASVVAYGLTFLGMATLGGRGARGLPGGRTRR
jgi:stage V sporulation protein B